jgi:DNA-binding transcriptional ArsR family regulator
VAGFAGFDKPDQKETAMTENTFRTIRLFKLVGNHLRFKILAELHLSPRSPGELALRTGRPLPAVSRALTLLNMAGLVSFHSSGHGVRYHLKHVEIAALLRHGELFIRRFELPAPPPFREDEAG